MHLITPGRSLQIPSWELQATRVTNFYQWQASRAKKPCNYLSQSDSYSYSLSFWLVWNLYALSLQYSLSKEGYLSPRCPTGRQQGLIRFVTRALMFGERGGREECQLVAGAPRGGETKPVLDRGREEENLYMKTCAGSGLELCSSNRLQDLLSVFHVVLPVPSPYNSHCVISAWSLPFPLTNKPNLTYYWQSYY